MLMQSLERVVSELGKEHSRKVLLDLLVQEVASYRNVALAGVWELATTEQCELCRANPEGAPGSLALHLCAVAGSLADYEEARVRFEGICHFGHREIRRVDGEGKERLIKEFTEVSNAAWVRNAGIRSFAGYPLILGGEKLGVLAVFTRSEPMTEVEFEWLRVFAAVIADVIVRSRARDEIAQLRAQLEAESGALPTRSIPGTDDTTILGSSPGIRRVLEQVAMVAPTDAAVLVLGETGVGKELVAQAIHQSSPRCKRPLVNVNCSAIPGELFESIFFGHVVGAFSGAVANRIGRFQSADGGSLFLDEVGDLPTHMQPKLLRVLQDGKFEPIGSEKVLQADVRVIAASNRDLSAAIDQGRFREDLFYRLSVFPIEVPPLREHKDDIPILSSHFLASACRRFGRPPLQFSVSQIRQLQNREWPGNVRELKNAIERSVITSRRNSLQIDLGRARESGAVMLSAPHASTSTTTVEFLSDEEMRRRERDNLAAALRASGGRIYGPGGAAELLGVKPTTLNARIRKWGLGKSE